MAKEGATVAISYLPAEQGDAEKDTQRVIEGGGGSCHLFPADLTEMAANQQLATDAVAALGGLDVLVCNAAFQMTYQALESFLPADRTHLCDQRLLPVLAHPRARGRVARRRLPPGHHLSPGLQTVAIRN